MRVSDFVVIFVGLAFLALGVDAWKEEQAAFDPPAKKPSAKVLSKHEMYRLVCDRLPGPERCIKEEEQAE